MLMWPQELPQRANSSDFESELPDGIEWAETETGPGKSRLGTWASVRPVTCSFDLVAAQMARFDRFYREECLRGSRVFALPDQEYDGLGLCTSGGHPLLTAGGAQILMRRWWLVRFSRDRRPTRRHLGGPNWRLGLALEIMP